MSDISKAQKKIKELFEEQHGITYLGGAGCSITSPSNIAPARKMMESIIRFFFPEEEIKRIINMPDIRFESLIEKIQLVDENLNILDYYSFCEFPNLQHLFLANEIIKGNNVMTTNFDNLIEYALLKLGCEKTSIFPVITTEDYINFRDFNHEICYPVFKIHGSVKNIISNNYTRESLIATLYSLAKDYDLNLFKLNPEKKNIIESITEEKTLFVMGYSGNDDFDIIPTLKLLEFPTIVWIDHQDKEETELFEILKDDVSINENHSKVLEILLEIKHSNPDTIIYYILGNTDEIVKNLYKGSVYPGNIQFLYEPDLYINDCFLKVDDLVKWRLAVLIYLSLNKFKDALRCSLKMCKIAFRENNNFYKAISMAMIGNCLQELKKYRLSIKINKNALKLFEIDKKVACKCDITHLNNIKKWKADTFNNIGKIYIELNNYLLAEDYLTRAKLIEMELRDYIGLIFTLNNITASIFKQGRNKDALEVIEEAEQLSCNSGHFLHKITIFNTKAIILAEIGEIDMARIYFQNALELANNLNDQNSISKIRRNLESLNQENFVD